MTHGHQSRYNFIMLTPTEKIWHNGRFINWNDATVHVLAHVVSYGSSVFEGIRCYDTPAGPAVFRAEGTYPAALRFRQNLPHGKPWLLAGATWRRHA